MQWDSIRKVYESQRTKKSGGTAFYTIGRIGQLVKPDDFRFNDHEWIWMVVCLPNYMP